MIKSRLFKAFNITAFLIFLSNSIIFGQVTGSSASGRNNSKTDLAVQAEARVLLITDNAGKHFKQGLSNLQENRRSAAREDFDKSVEVFLMSGVNVQSNQKLRECYSQLTETIYRMEFPAKQLPQIRSLSATCNWNIENDLADKIAKFVQPVPSAPTGAAALIAPKTENKNGAEILQGFSEQKFEASPLDDLAKLELTPEDGQTESTWVTLRTELNTLARLYGLQPVGSRSYR